MVPRTVLLTSIQECVKFSKSISTSDCLYGSEAISQQDVIGNNRVESAMDNNNLQIKKQMTRIKGKK